MSQSPPDDDPYADAPFVCPGCYAVGDEPCAGYCSDARMERETEWQRMYGNSEDDLLEEVDELLEYPDTEPAPDDGGDDVVQAVAILEAALEQTRPVQTEPLPLVTPRVTPHCRKKPKDCPRCCSIRRRPPMR